MPIGPATMPLPLDPPSPDEPPVDGPAVLARVARRIIPLMFVAYIINYLDRINISFAKLKMMGDLGLTNTGYGFGAGIFFVGYVLFEVPSNLMLEKLGARRWIARIMISWGVIASLMMFVRNSWSFSLLRFLLGVAEAGFFPGMVLYTTYWFPPAQRARALSWFLTSTALAGVLGSPLSGAILKMDGLGGLHGWQWVFLLEGLPSIPLGFFIWFYMSDRPADARWLAPRESAWLTGQLHADAGADSGADSGAGASANAHDKATLVDALGDGRVWLLSLIYFLLICGLYGFGYWAPTIVQEVSGLTDFKVGLVTAVPYLIAATSMVMIGRHSDRTGERRWHVAASAFTAAAGLTATPFCHHTGTALLALSVAAVGIWGSLGPFWTLPTAFLRGTAAAAGIAIINSLGCLSGFASPYVIGYLKDRTGGFTGGLLFVAGALLCGGLLVLTLPKGPPAARDRGFEVVFKGS